MKIEVRQADREDIPFLLGEMREADNEECIAASGKTADVCLLQGLEASSACFTILIEDYPAGMFGVVDKGNLGVPWLLASDRIYKAKRELLTESSRWLKALMGSYDYLENAVDARNTASLKWLKKIGFEISAPATFGISGRPFCKFRMERNNV